jgi:tRNA 5-methylaminomethyl-2-thiouridine biosynthesis bifunctional protein
MSDALLCPPEDTAQALLCHSWLAERLAGVPDGGHFVIAQKQFADGLSFLAVWRLWQQTNCQPHACLHFVSAFNGCPDPVGLAHTLQALTRRNLPELAPLADELIASFPPDVAGPHRLVLDQGRVRLTLCFGDLHDPRSQLEFSADVWLSGATLSGDGRPDPEPPNPAPAGNPGTIAIVGAGIAGSLLADNLARRHCDVTLLDQAGSVASAASGNRQGALYVKLGVDYNDQTQLALSSLMFSQRFYRRFEGAGWHPTGLLQLAYNDAEADRQARFLAKNQYPATVFEPVNATQASRIAGIPIIHGGLWFPGSGWLQPAKLCQSLSSHPAISHRFGFAVKNIKSDGAGWRLVSSDGASLEFDQVVICAGPDTPGLIPLDSQLRIKRIRGQITEMPADCINAPAVVVCGPGYLNPVHDGSALVGATFDLHDSSSAVSAQSDLENLEMLADLLPEALDASRITDIAAQSRGRVAFRCTTHDYQPLAGPMKTPEGAVLGGLYLFTGLGSKGLTYAPLLAEYLGDLISGQPSCLPENMVKRLETRRSHRAGKT